MQSHTDPITALQSGMRTRQPTPVFDKRSGLGRITAAWSRHRRHRAPVARL